MDTWFVRRNMVGGGACIGAFWEYGGDAWCCCCWRRKRNHRDGATEALSSLLISEGGYVTTKKNGRGGCFCGDLGQLHGVAEGRHHKD